MSHHHHRKRRVAFHRLVKEPPYDRTFRFELHGNPARTPTIHGETYGQRLSEPTWEPSVMAGPHPTRATIASAIHRASSSMPWMIPDFLVWSHGRPRK